MHTAVLPQPTIWPERSQLSPGGIAKLLDVDIVIINRTDANALRTYSTFGLDLELNWSEFAAAVDEQCVKGASIIPNVEVHPELSRWAAALVKRDIRFMVGLPLSDVDGWRVGSIAVLANHKAVALKGIPIRQLGELGRQFVGIKP